MNTLQTMNANYYDWFFFNSGNEIIKWKHKSSKIKIYIGLHLGGRHVV